MPSLIFSSPLIKKIIPFLLIAGIIVFQYGFDAKKQGQSKIPPTIIPTQILKMGDLGLHSAASALIWLYTIQNIPIKTSSLIQNINDLDPKFGYPYAFAAFFLPQINELDKAIKIAKTGIIQADSDWRIPYYLATTYHIHLRDRKNSAYYFNIAANTPNAPVRIKQIAARYATSKNYDTEQNKQIWLSIYETSDDELIRKRALDNIVHIEIAENLNRAIVLYRQKYGFYPPTIDSLLAGKILREIPSSPLGVDFIIGPDKKVEVKIQ